MTPQLFIPLAAKPAQTLTIALGGQNCRITIVQKSTGLFLSLDVSNSNIVSNVICQNANRIVRDPYLGFVGDLAFFDLQGSSDPTYDSLGSRYRLAYLA